MRRALLLAMLLAAPTLAAAQAPGEITFQNNRVNPLTVNATECEPTKGSTVTARWSPRFINGNASAPIGGTYIIYGSNQAPTGDQCFTQSNTTANLTVAVVADQDLNNAGTTAVISTSALILGAGKSCADEGAAVFICIQGVQGGTNNTLSNFGIATAQVTISTVSPPKPVITDVKPGDRALSVSWEAASASSAVTQNIELAARISFANEIIATITAGRFSASPSRFEGLTNDQGYTVVARAFSNADNASDYSDPSALVTPQVVFDYWDMYKNAGGRDSGGCSSGLAGPIGLGLLIATLALARRRQ